MNRTTYRGTSYTLELAVEGQCLVVLQTGVLPDLEEARRVQDLIARACAQRGIRRLVIDNRRTEAPSSIVRDSMRKWIHSGQYEAVGFVLESELLRVGVNMDALQAGRRVRAFADTQNALRWAENHRSSPLSVSSRG